MRTARTQQAIDFVVHSCLTAGHPLKPRRREKVYGDRHDLLIALWLQGLLLAPEEVIRALEALEEEGQVVQSETVYTYDSTEYILPWSLPAQGGPPPAGGGR
jgi:hypothetical protein